MSAVKIVTFNLPQFHHIPENDSWWGAGFTEWRNVAKARPLFPGHRQPNLPGDLGFYDMSFDETLERQGELAEWAGIGAFCYYHYWFAGRLLLERPLERLLARSTPQLPFCLCWANHSWTNHWVGGTSTKVLMEQTYPGVQDDEHHYRYWRNFLTDRRHLRVNGKPVLVIFRPNDMPQVERFTEAFRNWAARDGLGELFFIGLDRDRTLLARGFDALAPHALNDALGSYLRGGSRYYHFLRRKLRYPRWVIDYAKLVPHFENHRCDGLTLLPTAVPNWDNTPRVGRRGLVLSGCSPERFAAHLRDSVRGFEGAAEGKDRVLFIKSWNEWAEGNHLEPDLTHGRGWLEAVRDFAAELGKKDRHG
jgi:lipopolysaccharide biosynthesis protein